MPKARVSAFQRGLGHHKGCSVWTLRDSLTSDQFKDFEDALEDSDVSCDTISSVLGTWGHDITGQTIYRHRRAKCSCEKRAKKEAM